MSMTPSLRNRVRSLELAARIGDDLPIALATPRRPPSSAAEVQAMRALIGAATQSSARVVFVANVGRWNLQGAAR